MGGNAGNRSTQDGVGLQPSPVFVSSAESLVYGYTLRHLLIGLASFTLIYLIVRFHFFHVRGNKVTQNT